MTPDSPQSPREELEARLTALLLGELSADEAAALRHTIEQDPELARLESQLKETIGLVRQAAASNEEKTIEPATPLQLSAERREKLLASFKTTRLEIPTKKPRRTFRLNRELLKLAAMVVALLVVGGVLVSYFTTSFKMMVALGEPDPGELRSGAYVAGVPAGDAEKGKPIVVTANGSFESLDSPRASLFYVPSPSGNRAGKSSGGLGAEYAADAGLERSKAQILSSTIAPPPPAARPEPAKALPQLAQNAARFRTTIALPTSSEAQPSDARFDVSGVMATDSTPPGRGSSRADDLASSVNGSSDKLQIETLGEEATVRGRSEFAGRRGGFGGGGGFGSGRGPVAASEGKDSGRVSGLAGAGAPASVDAWRVGEPSFIGLLRDPEAAGAMGGQSFGFGNTPLPANKPPESAAPAAKPAWFADMDINGPAPAPAGQAPPRAQGGTAAAIAANPAPTIDPATGLPVASTVAGVASSSLDSGFGGVPDVAFRTLGFDGKDIKIPAPATAANPAPAVDPATGLPIASTTSGKDSSRLGLWDTGVDATPPVVAAQPVPSPAKPAATGGYEFQVTGDIGGLRFLHQTPQQGQGGQGGGASAAGLPVAGDVNNSEFQTADAPSRDGAVLDKNRNAGGVVEGEIAAVRGAKEDYVRVPARPVPARPVRPAVIPAETPSPTQKPDAANGLARDAAEVAEIKERMLAALATNGSWSAEILWPRTSPAPGAPPAAAFLSATIPAETPAPTQKPDAAKATSFPDDVDILLKQPQPNAVAVRPQPPTTPLPSIPAATPVPALESKEKDVTAGQLLSTIDGLAQKREGDAPGPIVMSSVVVTNGVSFGHMTGDDVLFLESGKQAATYINGPVITDPTHGTGDGREWGIRQKLDADGDSKARLDLLGDLTQMKSKKKALTEVQDKMAKVERGNTPGVHLVDAVARTNVLLITQNALATPPPVADGEQKKESQVAGSQTVTVRRSGGASGPVTVHFETETNGTFLDGTSAGKAAEYRLFSESFIPPESKRVSEESLSLKSRVEIALPPGGENVQGVEREPRMQTGPVAAGEIASVVINEIQSHPLLQGAKEGIDEFEQLAKSNEIQDASGKRSYDALKRQLDSANLVRDQLQKRVWQEKAGEKMPRSGGVQIIDRAEASPAKSSSLWGRITAAFSGDPVATARVATEKNEAKQALLSPPSDFDPYWVQSELEKIQSKAVLQKVIEKLDLDDTWAKEHGNGNKLSTQDTLRLLKKKLDVRTVPNSSQIDIRVKDDDSDEAARIANTIAEVYRDSRLAQGREMAAEGLQVLKERQALQEKEIALLKDELERRQKELKPEESDKQLPKLAATAGIPQPEIQSAENFFSTFSLNVSDVSFKLAAASLEKGQMPDPATVRSEEFINAFDYRDPEPKGSAPIAFAWERARYPFAHNRDLLRFSVKTAASGRQPGRPLNLVLLLDNSGSMERADRVRVIRECIRVLTRQLQPEDRVSVVAFARTARLVVDGFSGSNASNLPEVIGQLAPDGGTNLEDAMRVAYQTALKHFLPNGVNRVVLLTDGAANLGDVEPESLKKKVELHRKQGVALDCFGIGWDGYNDDLLEVLSRNGDGRYGFVNTPEAAASEFAGQLAGALRVAASDVKVQVQFNPRRVTAWRQIGYAKHQLKKEQFRDNTVDAAEIGAAEQGNALYTVQVNPNGEGPIGVVRVRFKLPGTSDYREHEWAVPYSGAATALEQSSAPMRLAATGSAFSEWLVSSPFAAEVTPDRLLGYLSGVPESCAADPRPKKLEWMIRQAKSLSGK